MNYPNQDYYSTPRSSQGLFEKLWDWLISYCGQLIFAIKTKDFDEVLNTLSFSLSAFAENFSAQEKRNLLILSILGIVLSYALTDIITLVSIDRLIYSQQSAKAESQINRLLSVMPWRTDLKLRRAQTYLSLNKEQEAISIIKTVLRADHKNSYLPKVVLSLSEELRNQDRGYEAIPLLEAIPGRRCRRCLRELADIYTFEGRKSLVKNNLARASLYLAKGLILSQKTGESKSSINHRKIELARTYNLQARDYTKSEDLTKAISALESSLQVYPIGHSYVNLAKLYYKRHQGIPDLKKALDNYGKAYLYNLSDYLDEYKKIIKELKSLLKAEGFTEEEIEKEIKKYDITEKITEVSQKEKTNEKASQKVEEEIAEQIEQPFTEEEIEANNAKNNLPKPPKLEDFATNKPAEASSGEQQSPAPKIYSKPPTLLNNPDVEASADSSDVD